MAEAPTAVIEGVEFNADHLEAAIDKFADEDGNINRTDGGYGVERTVAIHGDRYNDGDCHVTPVSNLTDMNPNEGMAVEDSDRKVWTDVYEMRQVIEDVLDTFDPFDPTEYVADVVAELNTVVSTDSDEAAVDHGRYDVEVQYGHFTDTEMGDLEADDAISFGKVNEQDGKVCIALDVDEDVATE